MSGLGKAYDFHLKTSTPCSLRRGHVTGVLTAEARRGRQVSNCTWRGREWRGRGCISLGLQGGREPQTGVGADCRDPGGSQEATPTSAPRVECGCGWQPRPGLQGTESQDRSRELGAGGAWAAVPLPLGRTWLLKLGQKEARAPGDVASVDSGGRSVAEA